MTCTSHAPEVGRVVRLIDGRDVCSCSREWAHECEARWMFDCLDLRQRRAQLADIGSKRGMQARIRMEETLTTMWNVRKAA